MSRNAAQRTLESYYRQSQYEDYGGREWCNILVALGDVPNLIVGIMSEISRERRDAWNATVAALGPTQGKASRFAQGGVRGRSWATKEVRKRPAGKGVQHETSVATKARADAHALDRRVKKQEDLYNEGKRCMNRQQWQKLLSDRDAAWDKATQLSEDSGAPYTDRYGQRRNESETPLDMFGQALLRRCVETGVEHRD